METAIGCASFAAVALLSRQCLQIRRRAGQPHQLYQDEDGAATHASYADSLKRTSPKLFMNAAAAVGVATSMLDASHRISTAEWSVPVADLPRIGLWVCGLKPI